MFHSQPANLKTWVQDEIAVERLSAASDCRHWPVAEIAGGRWFFAEHDCDEDSPRRFIAGSVAGLLPLLGTPPVGIWRFYVMVTDLRSAPEGVVFAEISDVYQSGDACVFRLVSGHWLSEGAASGSSAVQGLHLLEKTPRLCQVFRAP
jgi:hypothetical protein